MSVHQDVPRLRLIETQQKLDQGAFPGPGLANEGHCAAGLDGQVDVLEHRLAGGVGEVHVPELNSSAHVPQLGCARCIPDGDRGFDQVQDAPRRGHGALVEINGLGNIGHRPEQPLREKDQHAIGADVESPLQGHPAADEEGRDESGQNGHADDWNECRAHGDCLPVGLDVSPAVPDDPVGFEALGGEALDGRYAGDVCRQAVSELTDLLTHRRIERLGPALKVERTQNDHRYGREGNGRDQR